MWIVGLGSVSEKQSIGVSFPFPPHTMESYILLLLAYSVVFFLVLKTDQRANEYIPYFNISLVAILLASGLYTVSKE